MHSFQTNSIHLTLMFKNQVWNGYINNMPANNGQVMVMLPLPVTFWVSLQTDRQISIKNKQTSIYYVSGLIMFGQLKVSHLNVVLVKMWDEWGIK